MGVFIYLPDDDPDEQGFNGEMFKLQPGTTEIKSRWPDVKAETIADHIVEKLGRWGVCRVSGPVVHDRASTPEDQKVIDAAKVRYLKATRDWAQEIVRVDYVTKKPYRDAGLSVDDSEEAKNAKAWLESKKSEFKRAGLTG